MATRPVSNAGPVEVTNAQGAQFVIPLSALYFNDAGDLKADHWPPYVSTPALRPLVDHWLQYLLAQGLLTAGAAPPPTPAFRIEAADPGANGNTITIKIANVTPDAQTPGNSTADVTVTETNLYAGLTPAVLGHVIGTTAGGGSRPGLVFLASTTPTLPAAGQGALAGSPPQFDAGGAFTLQGKANQPDAVNTAIAIQNVDTGQGRFALQVTWTKSVSGVAMKDLDTQFGYVIHVSGGIAAPPSAGVVTLVGGVDAKNVSSAKAQGTVLAG